MRYFPAQASAKAAAAHYAWQLSSAYGSATQLIAVRTGEPRKKPPKVPEGEDPPPEPDIFSGDVDFGPECERITVYDRSDRTTQVPVPPVSVTAN
jgi:hypothetical protein